MEDNFEIQRMIETKDFNSLSVDEKNVVLNDITQEEYEQRRAILLSAHLFLNESVEGVKPRSEYKRSVAAIMQAKKSAEKTSIFQRVFAFKIPAYVSVAAVLLLLLWLPAFYSSSQPEKNLSAHVDTHISPKTIYVTDTVVVEKNTPTFVKVPVVKYVEVVKQNALEIPDGMNTLNTFEVNDAQQINIPDKIAFAREQVENQLKNSGRSSTDQEELNRFLVVSK